MQSSTGVTQIQFDDKNQRAVMCGAIIATYNKINEFRLAAGWTETLVLCVSYEDEHPSKPLETFLLFLHSHVSPKRSLSELE